MPTLILVESWQWTPFVFIIVYARLQALPQEIFEAAIADGAKPLATFRYVTLPLLMPAIIFAAVFRAVDSFRSFDLIFGLSYGGPARSTTTLSFFSFQNGFQWQNYGYAAAVLVHDAADPRGGHDRAAALRPDTAGIREMKRKIGRAFAYLVLIMLGLAGIAPIVYLGVLSTKKRIEILAQVPPTLDFKWSRITKNYNEVLFSQGMLEFTLNSIIVGGSHHGAGASDRNAGGLRVLPLPLSRQREPGVHDPQHALHCRRSAIAIPLYLMMQWVGTHDSYFGLILPYIAFSLPLVVWIMIGFFDEDPAGDRRRRDHGRLHPLRGCCGA